MRKKKLAVKTIFIFIFLFSILFSATLVESGKKAYTSSEAKPPGPGDWEYVGKCANGAAEWECKGQCEKSFEPKEREPRPRPTTPTPTPPTPKPPTQPPLSIAPNAAWLEVSGYVQAFDECVSLCNNYRNSGCSQSAALTYCSALLHLDLDKSGSVSSSSFAATPLGGVTCETSAHCFDVIKDCPCSGGQTLDLGTCVSLLYSSYASQGFDINQAFQAVSENLNGNCQQLGI